MPECLTLLEAEQFPVQQLLCYIFLFSINNGTLMSISIRYRLVSVLVPAGVMADSLRIYCLHFFGLVKQIG